MKNKLFFALFLFLTVAVLSADEPSPPYNPTKVDAKLNLTIKPDTDVVHFVRDNIRPNIYTKIYVLKHADPYELRQYLVAMVQTRKDNDIDTGIQAIQFNDGTKMIMVSAEDYRFDNFANGQSIDQLIKTLDAPGIAAVSGKLTFLYYPKYRYAQELMDMVRNVGAAVPDDITENIGGADYMCPDPSLNLIAFKAAPFSRKNIENALKNYDIPYPEIHAKITIYEIYAENDAKMGLDFQAWKNNDGIDLFSTGARFSQNYTPGGSNLSMGSGWSDLRYFNFNPKWNTKYVDFLASKGKARVLHSCEISVRNNTEATIDRTTQVFYAKAEPIDDSKYMVDYIDLPNTAFSSTPENGKTVVKATDSNGKPVSIVMDGSTASLTVMRVSKDPNVAVQYQMRIKDGHFTVNGEDRGTKIDANSVKVTSYAANSSGVLVGTDAGYSSDDVPSQKGNTINMAASNEFGFRMCLTPSITEKATILNVNISNSSMIGYTSDGTPRIQKSAEVASKFMVSNSGTKIVIGGIEKRDVVRVSGGLPLLKDIPVLGWIFSTESESTKRSQLLVVAEVIPVRARPAMTPAEQERSKSIDKDLEKAGDSNNWGYRQFLLDPERLK